MFFCVWIIGDLSGARGSEVTCPPKPTSWFLSPRPVEDIMSSYKSLHCRCNYSLEPSVLSCTPLVVECNPLCPLFVFLMFFENIADSFKDAHVHGPFGSASRLRVFAPDTKFRILVQC